ncbi:Choline/ethanolaminephosphotransferase [Ramicandelaber brevisporus]|nr:Choline/ethanolaminephosphotransferase [Ramicandelaber brevisporus]
MTLFGSFFSGKNFVSDKQLDNLRHYKYSAVDLSPVSKYILQPYWNFAVTLFPMWMAPNLITLLGFGGVVINLAAALYLIPDLVGPTYPAMYFSAAAGLWIYSTLDNVDGKQARRTGSSSPLGELFDHGCDALNCAVGGLLQAACMGLGHTWRTPAFMAITTIPFYMSTWEEYHTGTLFLGFVNGPTEGLIAGVALLIMSGMYGTHIWMQPATNVFPEYITRHFSADTPVFDIMYLFTLSLVLVGHIPPCLINIRRACIAKGKSFAVTLLEVIPIVIFSVSCYCWLASPFSSIISGQHVPLFLLTVGVIFGRMATKIILAHVTKSAFPWFTVQIVPLVAGAVIMYVPYLKGEKEGWISHATEIKFLWATLAFVSVAYLHWAMLVTERFTKHLGIKCFSIPYPPKQNKPKSS